MGAKRARNRAPEAVLSFHQLVENSDESFLLDNEALCAAVSWHFVAFRPMAGPFGRLRALFSSFYHAHIDIYQNYYI